MDDGRQRVLESGADGFIAKPCGEEELVETMRGFLQVTYAYEEVADESHTVRVSLSPNMLINPPLALMEALRHATLGGKKNIST